MQQKLLDFILRSKTNLLILLCVILILAQQCITRVVPDLHFLMRCLKNIEYKRHDLKVYAISYCLRTK